MLFKKNLFERQEKEVMLSISLVHTHLKCLLWPFAAAEVGSWELSHVSRPCCFPECAAAGSWSQEQSSMLNLSALIESACILIMS